LIKEKAMTRRLTLATALVLSTATVAVADRPKTYFDYVERAWACAEVDLRPPLEFRDGLVLAYPGTLVDVVHARHGNPRSILLVQELVSKDDVSPVKAGERFFAPIQVLPEHSYWRDNLPTSPRHGVLGGRRYIFKADDLEAAKALTRAYAETLDDSMPERRRKQQAIIVDALTSSVRVLREDALQRLTSVPVPAGHYEEATIHRLGAFAKSDAPAADRAQIVAVAGAAGMKTLTPDLELLAKKDDVVAASALQALEVLGVERSTEALVTSLGAKTVEIRSYAALKLGERAATDDAVRERVAELLRSGDDEVVRAAAATGLGATDDERVLDLLGQALARGDGASRAAAMSIAKVDSDQSAEMLKAAIEKGEGDAQVAGVLALVELRRECRDCVAFLKEQRTSHPDAGIRDLIGIVLELNVKHDH
jgi:hypothetical protein